MKLADARTDTKQHLLQETALITLKTTLLAKILISCSFKCRKLQEAI